MNELIPLVGMTLTLGPIAVLIVSFTPIGKAITARLRGQTGDDLDRRFAELREELRHELLEEQATQMEELHERVDFTERLLSARPPVAVPQEPEPTPV